MNDINVKSVGLRFRQIRERIGKKQEDFAEEMGITQTALSGIEQGKRMPTSQQIDFMIKNHNVTYDWLINGVSENANVLQDDALAGYESRLPACRDLVVKCEMQKEIIEMQKAQIEYLRQQVENSQKIALMLVEQSTQNSKNA